MLLNLTNHPHSQWSKDQLQESYNRWGTIYDLSFPHVDPQWDEELVEEMADRVAANAASLAPEAILCQGEMTLTLALVNRFCRIRIPVYAACSQRRVNERICEGGMIRKTTEFCFVRFREYRVQTAKNNSV